MHQQIPVFHRVEQCLEYAIYLGVYAVFHGGFSSPDGTKWNPSFQVNFSRSPLRFIRATLLTQKNGVDEFYLVGWVCVLLIYV